MVIWAVVESGVDDCHLLCILYLDFPAMLKIRSRTRLRAHADSLAKLGLITSLCPGRSRGKLKYRMGANEEIHESVAILDGLTILVASWLSGRGFKNSERGFPCCCQYRRTGPTSRGR